MMLGVCRLCGGSAELHGVLIGTATSKVALALKRCGKCDRRACPKCGTPDLTGRAPFCTSAACGWPIPPLHELDALLLRDALDRDEVP